MGMHLVPKGHSNSWFSIKAYRHWDGKDKNFKFEIRGRSDLNYATDPDSRRSITGTVVY